MQIKAFPLIFLTSLAWPVNAQQARETTSKEIKSGLSEQVNENQNQQSIEKVKKIRENKKSFIPSEKVSPDVPVSFPADI